MFIYRAGISIASTWNKKAQLWMAGRKNVFDEMAAEISKLPNEEGAKSRNITWFHCSSLGEFEQGRPLLEKLKSQYPDTKILLTFFSPSGYEIRKNYQTADWVFYLPMDSKSNADKMLNIVNPALVVFVKYDFWYYYLNACKERNIPLLLISAIFRKNQPFFKWYGGLHKKMLRCFTHVFVQEKESEKLLQQLHLENVTIAGDSRFDRVSEIAEGFQPIEEIAKFCGDAKVLVAGSTWPSDEKLIKSISALFPKLKIIIAPHEIHPHLLDDLKNLFPDSVYFSQINSSAYDQEKTNCLIIDNIGMLSKLYFYATIAYIGGGFDNGIHNVLEAAVYGKPVLFGPRHEKFQEATGLINVNAGYSVSDVNKLEKVISTLLNDQSAYKASSENAKTYVVDNKGATEKILEYIQENRLFTN